MRDIRFFVQPAPWACGCELYIQYDGAWVQRVECVQVDEGTIPPVAMQLRDEQAQDLIDKLWQAGYRPTEGKGSAGALAATERHLADMRRLVFKTE
jgi:hypothetical protein